MDNRAQLFAGENRPKRLPSEYFKDNFYATTSGSFSFPGFHCAYLVVGADNILFAVDYPMETAAQAVQFLETLPISGGDREKVSHLNAEKLFGLSS